MGRSRATNPDPDPVAGPAFLLSQVGAHAAMRFAERLAPLGLALPHVGILVNIARADGLSQQALSEKLGMFPSRLVGVLDELEQRGLVERRDSPIDRRSYALYLTAAGRAALEQIGRIGREHQDALCAALDPTERAQLTDLLRRIAAQQQLTPGVHPGLRRLGGGQSGER
jgi:DNA-binding MarR family transcriptional regulator